MQGKTIPEPGWSIPQEGENNLAKKNWNLTECCWKIMHYVVFFKSRYMQTRKIMSEDYFSYQRNTFVINKWMQGMTSLSVSLEGENMCPAQISVKRFKLVQIRKFILAILLLSLRTKNLLIRNETSQEKKWSPSCIQGLKGKERWWWTST